MLSNKYNSKRDDDDYDANSDPKRKNYKKIKLEIKKSMINDFYQNGIEIPCLTKKYHLSYSTIAHILKVYKQKNRIFESKRSKDDRQIQQSLQRQTEIKEQIVQNIMPNVKIQTPTIIYYPFFPEWTFSFY